MLQFPATPTPGILKARLAEQGFCSRPGQLTVGRLTEGPYNQSAGIKQSLRPVSKESGQSDRQRSQHQRLTAKSQKLKACSSRLAANRYKLNRRSRKALETTLMLEKAIAPAARMGLSWRKKSGAQVKGARTPAAIGIRATL